MDRRTEIKAIGTVAACAFVPAIGDGYQPVGYLEAGMPLAPRVISVTVDGVEQFPLKVRRGDDIEGWIEVFCENAKGKYVDPATGNLARDIRRGVVRFKFRPEEA